MKRLHPAVPRGLGDARKSNAKMAVRAHGLSGSLRCAVIDMRSFLSNLGRRPSPPSPDLSIIVVSYNMRREIPRTLESLSVPYQKNIEPSEYEIVLVDNGSKQP